MGNVILTGDRPTGRLHVGHYVGSLKRRVEIQNGGDYDKMFVMIADAQALTDNAENPEKVRQNIIEVTLDYLSCGLSPDKTTMFIQSQVPELTELSFYYMNLVTVSRLQRNPTVKNEIQMRNFETSIPVGFFTYPISQAADITAFKANVVPVGEDQLPMIEQTNEIVRKFNSVYGETLVEAKAVLPTNKVCLRLPGTDGKAKMSKSLGNSLLMSDLLSKYSNEAIKLALLSTNYRNDINVTPELFPEAEKHLYEFYKVYDSALKAGIKIDGDYPGIDDKFDEDMSDDFNTALAISDLYGYFRTIRGLIAAKDEKAGAMLSQIRKTYSLIGLFKKDPTEYVKAYEAKHDEPVPAEITAMAEKMQNARLQKDYAAADALRADILQKGYLVMISKDGVSVKKQ